MKRILLVIAAVGLATSAWAQKTSGVVSYEQKINLHKKIEDESMKAYVPEFQVDHQELLFTATESLYRTAKQKPQTSEESTWTESDGTNVQIRMEKPENITYFNFKEKKKVESTDFLGRKFLIEDELKAIPWKITGEMKKLNGHQCNKAVFDDQENERTVVAWFAPGIPTQAGPGKLGQLPGLILEVNVNDGEIITVATDIAFKEGFEEGTIVAPDKGKKVNNEEYRKIVDEKMKEMGMEGGGKGGVKIKIKTN